LNCAGVVSILRKSATHVQYMRERSFGDDDRISGAHHFE
jgi:hypothetical protein